MSYDVHLEWSIERYNSFEWTHNGTSYFGNGIFEIAMEFVMLVNYVAPLATERTADHFDIRLNCSSIYVISAWPSMPRPRCNKQHIIQNELKIYCCKGLGIVGI